MEEAAMKAYEEDMKRLKAEAGNIIYRKCVILTLLNFFLFLFF